MPDSALFAYVVCVQLATSDKESVCEISADQITTHDEDGDPYSDEDLLSQAVNCARLELTSKYGAEISETGDLVRVHRITLGEELVYGKEPVDEQAIAAEAKAKAAADAEEKAAADRKAKNKGKGKSDGA